jgi:pimeloyl-ACP methyl ester carboxylesterase
MPRVDNKGISIHYRVEGNGPPLILQHGFSDSSDRWFEHGFVAALKQKYRLVLIDVRGHGQSDKPHDPPSYAPEKFVSDIVAVLDDLGMKTAIYWGYSMGGWIGFAMARYALDRVGCFVLGGAAGSGASPYAAEPGKEHPFITTLRSGLDAYVGSFGEELTAPLRERLLTNDPAALIACTQQRLVTGGFHDVVRTIAVPTLLYAGTADPIHDAARQTASEIGGAQFVSVPSLSHLAAMSRSDLVLPHDEPFLAEVLLRPAQSTAAS